MMRIFGFGGPKTPDASVTETGKAVVRRVVEEAMASGVNKITMYKAYQDAMWHNQAQKAGLSKEDVLTTIRTAAITESGSLEDAHGGIEQTLATIDQVIAELRKEN